MKNYIFILLFFITNLSYGQILKTSILFSTGISKYNFSDIEEYTYLKNNNDIKLCFSGGLREELDFTKIISFIFEINYKFTNGYVFSPIENDIPEESSVYCHYITTNSFYMSILLKIKTNSETNKGIYFYFGPGIKYILYSRTNIVFETFSMSGILEESEPVLMDNVFIKNQKKNDIGMIGLLGIGKSFKIKKKTFFCEAKYDFDLNKWIYPNINGVNNSPIDIKQQCLLLNLGFTF